MRGEYILVLLKIITFRRILIMNEMEMKRENFTKPFHIKKVRIV